MSIRECPQTNFKFFLIDADPVIYTVPVNLIEALDDVLKLVPELFQNDPNAEFLKVIISYDEIRIARITRHKFGDKYEWKFMRYTDAFTTYSDQRNFRTVEAALDSLKKVIYKTALPTLTQIGIDSETPFDFMVSESNHNTSL
jgi:hypothetical protein